jgi:murein DD-endopeptidase MepM/ murein hydrolase activator NlpD
VLLALSPVALSGVVVVAIAMGAGSSPTTIGDSATGRPTAAADATTDGQPTAPAPTDAASPSQPPPLPTSTPTPLKEVNARSLDPEELTGYVWPLRNSRITSRFAPRDYGGFLLIDGKPIHDGLDIATFCGDKVRAAHDGTVLYAGRNFDVFLGYQGEPEAIYARLEKQGRVRTLPIVIVVDDGNGYRSIYVHLNKANVEAGDVVSAGDIIGAEGNTGLSTGCHLHYGLIRMDGTWQQVLPQLTRFGYPARVRARVDPLDVLSWGDEHAPRRLRDRVNASPSAGTGADAATPSPSAPS